MTMNYLKNESPIILHNWTYILNKSIDKKKYICYNKYKKIDCR